MGERATAVIRPVKVTEYDADLHCDVRRVVGYRVECKCGWRSTTHPSIGSARSALANHRRAHAGQRTSTAASSKLTA